MALLVVSGASLFKLSLCVPCLSALIHFRRDLRAFLFLCLLQLSVGYVGFVVHHSLTEHDTCFDAFSYEAFQALQTATDLHRAKQDIDREYWRLVFEQQQWPVEWLEERFPDSVSAADAVVVSLALLQEEEQQSEGEDARYRQQMEQRWKEEQEKLSRWHSSSSSSSVLESGAGRRESLLRLTTGATATHEQQQQQAEAEREREREQDALLLKLQIERQALNVEINKQRQRAKLLLQQPEPESSSSSAATAAAAAAGAREQRKKKRGEQPQSGKKKRPPVHPPSPSSSSSSSSQPTTTEQREQVQLQPEPPLFVHVEKSSSAAVSATSFSLYTGKSLVVALLWALLLLLREPGLDRLKNAVDSGQDFMARELRWMVVQVAVQMLCKLLQLYVCVAGLPWAGWRVLASFSAEPVAQLLSDEEKAAWNWLWWFAALEFGAAASGLFDDVKSVLVAMVLPTQPAQLKRILSKAVVMWALAHTSGQAEWLSLCVLLGMLRLKETAVDACTFQYVLLRMQMPGLNRWGNLLVVACCVVQLVGRGFVLCAGKEEVGLVFVVHLVVAAWDLLAQLRAALGLK